MKRAAFTVSCFVFAFLAMATRDAMAQPFAYVANQGSNSISGYTIDPESGALTELPSSPFQAGSGPASIQFTNPARFAYVANSGESTVSGYSLNGTNGVLTPIAGSPYPTDASPLAVAISPSGKYLYTANFAGDVSAFSIDGETGELTPVAGSPFHIGANEGAEALAFTPSGAYLYVSSNPFSPGPFGYVTGFAANADGSLTQIAGSPFTTGVPPGGLVVSPSGFLYVPAPGNTDIYIYSINTATGALTWVGVTSVGSIPQVTEVTTSSGEYLCGGGGILTSVIDCYLINTSTGALMGGTVDYAGPDPSFVVASRSAKFLYVADNQGSEVSGYSIDAAANTLPAISGSPFATGSRPASIALADPAVSECGALNVSSEVTFTPGPYTRQAPGSDLFDETLTITNGVTDLLGPLYVVLLGLPSATTTLSGTYEGLSTTYCFSAAGNYVVPIDSLLPAGHHDTLHPNEAVSVPFVFQATENGHAAPPSGYEAKLIRGKLDK
jgi:6-phosphogluconolactonase (cycloisomerase 2 family)